MADAERLMNLMESFAYKSEQYNVCRKVLLAHLAQKPSNNEEDEVTAWTMTGPSPFDIEMPAPVDFEVPAQVDFEIPEDVDEETTAPNLVESPIESEPSASPASTKPNPSSKKAAAAKPKKAKKKTSRKSRPK
jgi:hypothetical protein